MRKQESGWKGESRRHSLAKKGIKTSKGEFRDKLNQGFKSFRGSTGFATRQEILNHINSFKDPESKKLALEHLSKTMELNIKPKLALNGIYWRYDFTDDYGNEWDGILIADRLKNRIVYRKSIVMDGMNTFHKIIKKLDGKEDYFTSDYSLIPSHNLVYKMMVRRNPVCSSTIAIQINGDNEKEINSVRKKFDTILKENNVKIIQIPSCRVV